MLEIDKRDLVECGYVDTRTINRVLDALTKVVKENPSYNERHTLINHVMEHSSKNILSGNAKMEASK